MAINDQLKMQIKGSLVSVLCLFSSLTFAVSDASSTLSWKEGWQPAPSYQTDFLAAEALSKLAAYYAANSTQDNCTLENAAVRREWYCQLLVAQNSKHD